MPQLNPEFFVSQLFWLTIFFTFLLVFMWKVSLPRIAKALNNRQKLIDENLTSAKELQEQAKLIEDKINNQINEAKQNTDDQIKKTISSLQNDISKQLLSLDNELEEKIAKSEEDILKNRDDQMKNIQKELEDITKFTISKITNVELSGDEISKAIKTHKGQIN